MPDLAEVSYKVIPQLEVTGGIRVSGTKLEFSRASDGPVNGGPASITGEDEATPVTPKFAVAYKPGDDLNLYVTAQKGFRITDIHRSGGRLLTMANPAEARRIAETISAAPSARSFAGMQSCGYCIVDHTGLR